jgi:hypothetical protein
MSKSVFSVSCPVVCKVLSINHVYKIIF